MYVHTYMKYFTGCLNVNHGILLYKFYVTLHSWTIETNIVLCKYGRILGLFTLCWRRFRYRLDPSQIVFIQVNVSMHAWNVYWKIKYWGCSIIKIHTYLAYMHMYQNTFVVLYNVRMDKREINMFKTLLHYYISHFAILHIFLSIHYTYIVVDQCNGSRNRCVFFFFQNLLVYESIS